MASRCYLVIGPQMPSTRNRSLRDHYAILLTIAGVILLSNAFVEAQRGRGAGAATTAPSVPHDPHDLSGVWTRQSRVLTMSTQTPPMTAWGKAKFEAAKPVYGPRAVA